jgi:hypothetical protein
MLKEQLVFFGAKMYCVPFWSCVCTQDFLHCYGKIVICTWPEEKINTNILKSDPGKGII